MTVPFLTEAETPRKTGHNPIEGRQERRFPMIDTLKRPSQQQRNFNREDDHWLVLFYVSN